MQLDTDISILQKLPLFSGMDRENISMIAFSSERLLFHPGEQLATDGQLGHAAYVILSGSAQIIEGEGDKRRIHMISPGTIVGELAMLVEYTFTQTVTAMEEVEVLELPRELVHLMMRQFPGIGEHFSMRIHSRLSVMAENLRRFDQPDAPLSQHEGML